MDGPARQADPGQGTAVETAVLAQARAWQGATGLAMDWSGVGNGTGTRAAVWWWPALVTAAVAQGDRARQALSSEGGGGGRLLEL